MGLFSKKKKKAPEPKPAPKSNANPPEQSEKVEIKSPNRINPTIASPKISGNRNSGGYPQLFDRRINSVRELHTQKNFACNF